jgi:peptide/nickel transport system substrate-binding protein
VRRNHRITGAAVAAAVALATCMSACSSTQHVGAAATSSAAVSGPYKPGGTIAISNEQGQTWDCQFNPFGAGNSESEGFVYETLDFVDILNNDLTTPMLATSYQWNAAKTAITFSIRQGVQWNDGQPFTAQDVAYTFNLLKQDPGLDVYSLWSAAGLQSATATGDTATLTFSHNAETYFYYFAGSVPIVPEHVWDNPAIVGKTPDTWGDPNPVGTGPFEVSPCTANNIQYTANPHYWQPDEPHVQKVEYPAYLSNDPANNDLASGQDNWGGQYIPSIQSFYLAKSSNFHVWSPPVTEIELMPNLKQGATADLDVREAMAYAVNTTQIAAIGEGGEETGANQTSVIAPTFSQYENTAALDAAGYNTPNTTKAASLLAQAGYSPSHPLDLTVINVTGYTDWDADLQVMKSEFQQIGIDLTVTDLADQTYTSDLQDGKFQLAFVGESDGGPTPYYELRALLDSSNSAPIGQQASTNYERYDNPAVDALLANYATATPAGQIADIKQVSADVIQDVPVIPVIQASDWFQYDTQNIQGWPTAADPYAQPSPYSEPDLEQVLLHVYSQSAQ